MRLFCSKPSLLVDECDGWLIWRSGHIWVILCVLKFPYSNVGWLHVYSFGQVFRVVFWSMECMDETCYIPIRVSNFKRKRMVMDRYFYTRDLGVGQLLYVCALGNRHFPGIFILFERHWHLLSAHLAGSSVVRGSDDRFHLSSYHFNLKSLTTG